MNVMTRKLSVIALAALVAGCQSSAPAPANKLAAPPPSPAPTVADAATRARIHTELASAYFELGNYGVALQSAQEALKADSNHAAAYNVLGLVYMELRDDGAAEANFQRSLRISPVDSDANNNYGWFLCQRKREQESIKYFLTALRNPLYSTPDKSWVNAGICARQSGDVKSAEGYFLQALKVRPLQVQALFQMADISHRRKEFVEAKSFLGRLLRELEPSAEVLWLALRVERALGDRNAEASLGFQLRQRFPESREARELAAGRYE